MPIHDWTRVDAGLFHHFHQKWTVALSDDLNSGGLPPDYFALIEQRLQGPIPDVLTLKLTAEGEPRSGGAVGLAVAEKPPLARVVSHAEAACYAQKANRITVRHRHGDVVAVVEVVSPGNKSSRSALRAFAEKSADLMRQQVHLLVVDLFPPSRRDPRGIHPVIWEEFVDEEFDLPPGRPLTIAAYQAGDVQTAYVSNVAVRETLPDMPIFLNAETYVPAPLEATYEAAWKLFPAPLKRLLDS